MRKLNPQGHCINGTLFDWQAAGFKRQGWPAALKDAGSTTCEVESLCAYFGDPWTSPASGGLIRKANLARELGISERQLQREVECGSASFIRIRGKLLASNVQSLDYFRRVNDTGRAEAQAKNSPFKRK